jgi:formiminoglutamase
MTSSIGCLKLAIYKNVISSYNHIMTNAHLQDIILPGINGSIVLLGFPHDTGVAINGGRVGAAQGPEQFRFWLRRFGTIYNPERNADFSRLSITDAGDIPSNLSHEDAHAALAEKTGEILKAGGIPFVVGGGNDQSYPNAEAMLGHHAGQAVGVVNIDAHLDVRPLKAGRAHSGSSFRQLLEDPRFQGKNFVEFACQGSQCDREHAEYVLNKGGRILWLDKVRERDNAAAAFRETLGSLAWRCPSIFVSFDLDSVSSAPGVSCPCVAGLTASDALSIAEIAGRHPAVGLFDLSEYNPAIEAEQTGRLAAAIFYFFCLGFVSRKTLP